MSQEEDDQPDREPSRGSNPDAQNSQSPNLTAVVAVTSSGVIGLDGDMPWRLSSDLRRFKKMTMGGILVMGRKTFDSIGKPLPGRQTVVITRNPDWHHEGVTSALTVDAAVAATIDSGGARPAFVVGGAEIYRLMLPQCRKIFLTRVWSNVVGDTNLEIDLSEFRISERTRLPATARDDVPTEFQKMIRQNS